MSDNSSYRILAGTVADHRMERHDVIVNIHEREIVSLDTWNDSTRPESGDIDARDAIVLPGFIDIHIHGGAGRSVMEGTYEALYEISKHLARHGVTGWLPTTVTAAWEDQIKVLDAVENCLAGFTPVLEAAILGVHLEGPYINPKKKGAQPEQFILLPDMDEFQRLTSDHFDNILIMTLAPEMPGALEFIRFLVSQNIIASIGHTDATYAEISAAIDAGASHLTHTFNAMRPMDSREPGVVGAAFSRPELTAELIWDNVHVHPASCRALVAAKGTDGVILISDGVQGAGMPDGYSFSFGDLPINIKDGRATLPDGTLAGSVLTLDQAFRNAQGYTLSQRSAMTSYNAARSLRSTDGFGTLAPGHIADLVILNRDETVRRTIVNGVSVYVAA